MYRCVKHELDYTTDCPLCLAEQRHAEITAYAEQSIEQTRENAYKQFNPGEYKCPECRYITLKRYAVRCPVCRASVSDLYWEEVTKREQRAAEEWKQSAPERERQRIAQAQEAERKEKEGLRKAYVSLFIMVSMWIIGPLLGGFIGHSLPIGDGYRGLFGFIGAIAGLIIPQIILFRYID